MIPKIARSFSFILSSQVLLSLLGAISTPLIVRVVGSDGYGRYAVILSTFSFLMIFANFSIFTSLRKYMAEDRDDTGWRSRIFWFYFKLSLVSLTATYLLLIVGYLTGTLQRVIDSNDVVYVIILILLVSANQFKKLGRSALMSFDREDISETFNVVDRIVFIISGVYLASIGWGEIGLFTGMIVGMGIASCSYFAYLSRHISIRDISAGIPNSVTSAGLLRYNTENTLLILLTVSLYNLDILLLSTLNVPDSQIGFYRAGLQIGQFLWVVPTAIATVFIHSLSHHWTAGNIDEINRMSSQSTRYTVLFLILCCGGLVAVAEPFVLYYLGREFLASVTPLIMLLPGIACYGIARQIFAVGEAKGDFKLLIFATGSSSALNFVLNLLLIPPFGITGAAVATSIGYGSMLVFHTYSARQLGFYPFSDVEPLNLLKLAVTYFVILIPLARTITSPIWSLVLIPPLGGVLFLVLAMSFDLLSKVELLRLIQ